jgi:hypothetical protein
MTRPVLTHKFAEDEPRVWPGNVSTSLIPQRRDATKVPSKILRKMRPVLICEYVVCNEGVVHFRIVGIEEQFSAIPRFRVVLAQDVRCDHLC